MDGNRDDAERCLRLAENALAANDRAKAQRLLEKSRRMYPLPDQQAQLEARIHLHVPSGTSSKPTSSKPFDVRDKPEEKEDENAREPTPAMKKAVQGVQEAKDHYQVLGVDRSADTNAVKKAYKKLALKLHPDRNYAPGADDAFKKVGAAFLTLSDEERRAHYNQFGTDMAEEGMPDEGVRRRQQQRAAGNTFFTEFVHMEDLDEAELLQFLFSGTVPRGFGPHRRRTRPAATRAHRQHQRAGNQRQRERHAGSGGNGLWERFRPLMWLILFMVITSWMGGMEQTGPAFSLDRTRYYAFKRESFNGVVYYTAERGSLPSKDRMLVEHRADVAALERWYSKCSEETLRQREYYRMSQRWLISNKERERYRQLYIEFQKPWCARTRQLRDGLRRQGFTY